MIPITNIVVQNWVDEDGILEQTFNETDFSAWNTTGQLLTANSTKHIPLTGFEKTVTQLYVPSMIVFFIIIMLYVLSKWSEKRQRG
jgi:hypothetical protein